MPMQIYVTMAGMTITLTLDDVLIRHVKVMIQDQVGIAEDKQFLCFGNIQLEDFCTLSEYNIQPKSMLHLVAALPPPMCSQVAKTDTTVWTEVWTSAPSAKRQRMATAEQEDRGFGPRGTKDQSMLHVGRGVRHVKAKKMPASPRERAERRVPIVPQFPPSTRENDRQDPDVRSLALPDCEDFTRCS